MTIARALISLTDKRGVVDFARGLADAGTEILSTGNTARVLRESGVPVTEVAEFTGSPEILDGRVKTLHPKVHGGILARRDDDKHIAQMNEHGLVPIDLVAVNLYPFEKTIANPDVTLTDAIENIDIGGPSMIRSAAKNHEHVAVVVDPDDYPTVLSELRDHGGVSLETRRALAAKAFARTAAYDTAITRFLESREEFHSAAKDADDGDPISAEFLRTGDPTPLRYGENPHQRAAFFPLIGAREPSVATAEQRNGKALSYNNLMDSDAAHQLVCEFSAPSCAVIKHTNPCGAATADDPTTAFQRALAGDPLSAFGGIVAFNRAIDADCARAIATPDHFFECIVAPSFSDDAIQVLTTQVKWGKNLRILETGEGPRDKWDLEVRKIRGGLLIQERDATGASDPFDHRAGPPLTEAMERTLRFAWLAGKHVKSNAIVLAKDAALVGVGAGQMSRVDSVKNAVEKAGDRAVGAALASDAFFPFRDGIDAAAAAGVTAIAEPGGSRRDDEVIAAANEHGITLVFTGSRHFKH